MSGIAETDLAAPGEHICLSFDMSGPIRPSYNLCGRPTGHTGDHGNRFHRWPRSKPYLRPLAEAAAAAMFEVPERFMPSSISTASPAASGIYRAPRWMFPDPNPFPRFTFWPAIDRAQEIATVARERVVAAVGVLRHGLPEEDW